MAVSFAYFFEFADINTFATTAPRLHGLGRLSNAAGPLIIAALYTGTGYQSVFFFIAGMWLLGALALTLFGPSTRRARLRRAAQARPGGLSPRPITGSSAALAPTDTLIVTNRGSHSGPA